MESERTCRLCTRDVSDSAAAIHLYSSDSVERGVADKMATLLEVPLDETEGLGSYICELCNARFNHLVRSLEVHRLNAKKNYEKQAKKAGIYVETLEDMIQENPTGPTVEDANDPHKDPLVQAADMTGMDLGSLLSDLVAAKKKMREKKGVDTDKKVVTEDIKDLMNLLSGIRKEDIFVFGTFLGVPDSQLRDIEKNYVDNPQRFLTEVVTAWINACPETSTWSTLVEALTEVGRRKPAQEVAERRGIVLPGVFDDGQLWSALKALIPINEGGDLVTLLEETEKLRKDVKTKDALLVESEDRLEEINSQKDQFEKQYNDSLEQLEEQKKLLEDAKQKSQKDLREREAELRKLRAERATKEEIESKEIEIMYLKKKVQQHQAQEKELMAKIVELQKQLEATDIGKLDWIASNLEKQMEGVRPEFEQERSQMMTNIYRMLKYIKIPDNFPESDEEEEEGGGDAQDPTALPAENVETEELRGEGNTEDTAEEPKTPEPEPADLESLLSSLKSPTEAASASSMFEDKSFIEEEVPLAVRLFGETPPFLLSQILGLSMEEWLTIEREPGDKKEAEKQRGSVLLSWGRTTRDSAKWSVLVEALIILGLRSNAQIAYMEKGVPLPEASEDGPLWSSLKNTLLTGNQALQEKLVEMEGLLVEVKRKDEDICARESVLEQAQTEGELINTSLKRAKQDLARKVLQCKTLEVKMGQISPSTPNGVSDDGSSPGEGVELEGLKSQHRESMEAVQSLWKETETKKAEYESHVARLGPQEEMMNQMRGEFSAQRNWLVTRLEEMYDLHTGREKPVETEEELVEEEEEEGAEEDEDSAEVLEEIEQQATPEPEPADLETLLSSLTGPTASAISMFEDKSFSEEEVPLAVRLFGETPPFLLSQILGLSMEEWLAIERGPGHKKEAEKQRGSVLLAWGRTRQDSAKWSVLVEALIILGLRGNAQIACIEKGVPLPHVSEDGPLWSSVEKTLMSGNPTVQQMLTGMEGVRAEVKRNDEEICSQESVLEQARTEKELIHSSLKRAKQDLAREMTQCKILEGKIGQMPSPNELFADDIGGEGAELEGLKSQHRESMEAVQSLWNETEGKKAEYESHVARLGPQEEMMNQIRSEFSALRNWLVTRLEEMYDLHTGREKPVPKATPDRPPPPKPRPTAPPPPPPPAPPPSFTPGGYRTATDQLVPTNDPILPTGYTIMDLFHPSNTFCLLPGIDPVGRPLAVGGNVITGITIKGRGSLSQECGLVSEVAAPFIVTLRIPNRGRLMVDDRRAVSIKNTPYKVGDPAFEFIIRPYKDTKVTFESRKFLKSFLMVDQSAHLSVQEMPPDSSEVQFAVRVQRFVGPYTTPIKSHQGRPSIVNQLKDRSVIQLYSKATGIYLGLKVNGDVVGMTNSDNDKTFLVYCDRGLGRASLQSYTPPLLKVKMRFNGALVCQGEENLDNDFYLKEAPDGTVLFESVPNKGRYIQVTMKNKKNVTIVRNFSIVVLVLGKERGRTATVTKYALN